MLKVQLLNIVSDSKRKCNLYIIDELAKSNNKTVHLLPPYHCELDTIEKIWTQLRSFVSSNDDVQGYFEGITCAGCK